MKGINVKYTSTEYFDKNGNPTKSISEDEEEGMTYTSKYKYNSKGLLTQQINTSEYEDPMTGHNKETTKVTYKYSNYYKNKYPRTTIMYVDGEIYAKIVTKYKTIKS